VFISPPMLLPFTSPRGNELFSAHAGQTGSEAATASCLSAAKNKCVAEF